MSRSSKKLSSWFAVVLVLLLTSRLSAAFVWTDNAGNHCWNDRLNWNNGVPDTSTWCRVDLLPGAVVNADTPVVGNVHVGRYEGNPGAVTVNGGIWGVNYWLTLSRGADATLTINGGSVGTVIGSNLLLIVGHAAGHVGTLNMNGGLLRTQRGFRIGNEAGSIGHVNLYGGTIECDSFAMNENAASVKMDVTNGTLIVDGKKESTIQEYIDSGYITAFGHGPEMLELDYDVTNPGKTTLKAVDPLQPHPVSDVTVSSGMVELSWTLLEPNKPWGAVTCDVFWGTDPESDFVKIVERQSEESKVVNCPPLRSFCWQVIVYDSSADSNPVFESSVYTFNTYNVAPEVEAGQDQSTWLADGYAMLKLDGDVTDEGSYTVEWSNVSDPSPGPVTIVNSDAEDTSVTFVNAGTYELLLEADDGYLTGSDTVRICVYADDCEAAKSLPEYIPLVGDVNEDCQVDFKDLELLLNDWLRVE